MKSLKTEIISIGTELLLGQIANTNAQWLSQQLALNGVNTYYHTVVGDNMERLEKTFQQAQQRSDVIIVTGGLGPTEDDLTREAFQQISGFTIVNHDQSLEKIKSFFKKQKKEMTENNKRQARIFDCATVLENKTGMAPGMRVTYKNKMWIFLPGVPREMKQIAIDDVFPLLQKENGHMLIKSKVLRFIGIGESELEERLKSLIQAQSNPTIAPLAAKDGVTIRLTAKASSVDEAEKLLEKMKDNILEKVGQYYFGSDDQQIEEIIVQLLVKKGLNIAAAESLTGGKFTDKLISSPGASQVCRGGIVCYDTNVKRDVLNVSEKTLACDGTVSERCAREMAENVAKLLKANIGISFTGVAGPDQSEGKEVGTVYIGLYSKKYGSTVQKFIFQGNRQMIRTRTVLKGLEILFKTLK